MVRFVTATAPVRIADLGGWTDTWFAGHGLVCSVAVWPGAEVRISFEEASPGDGGVTIDATDYGDRYVLSSGRGRHPLLEACVDEVGVPPSLDVTISVHSSVPPGASTGTSAAVSVALVGALTALGGGRIDAAQVATRAHRVETVHLGRQSGIQDQWAAAVGGVVRIEMRSYPDDVDVAPVAVADDVRGQLERRLVLVSLGRPHLSSLVHDQVIAHLEGCAAADTARLLDPLREAAATGCRALVTGDLGAYAAAMVANTEAQAALHPGLVSPEAAAVIAAAQAAGAVGWKVNGAGGDGGSLTLLAGPEPGSRLRVSRRVLALGGGLRVIPVVLAATGLRVRHSGYMAAMANSDPHTEPENSTVDDWMGQEVNADAELADKLVEESGGDLAAAEEKFEQQSAGAEPNEGNVPRANGEGHS